MEYMYAALLLHKAGKEINEENLKKVLEAAGVTIDESKVRSIVTALKEVDIEKAIEETSVGVTATSVVETEEKKEEKKKEEKPEEAAEGLGALFG